MNKEYIWIGPKRYVPGLGVKEHGDEVYQIGETMAKALCKQGLIKLKTKKKSKKSEVS
jgi:hypothetical protein